jgi:hypothetical protein
MAEAVNNGLVSGDGQFTKRYHALLEQQSRVMEAK